MFTLNPRCNIYSTMFFSVLTTFLTFLLWYSLFIIAFGLGFFILLHSDAEMKKEEKPKFFDHIGLSLVKTFSMFVGELEFSEVPFQVSPRSCLLVSDCFLTILYLITYMFPRFSYIFFLIFIFLMVVVLMNLLNGLAVRFSSLNVDRKFVLPLVGNLCLFVLCLLDWKVSCLSSVVG